ncbi:MAG: SDR family NAD(P)-dependent oxidoreductase [Pseudomonadota bacterium]
MTEPLAPPPRKDPQKRTVSPTLPPMARSRAALGLTAAAAEGRFALQVCADCGAVQYPPRDACAACLSPDLVWRDQPPGGRLLAETTIRVSPQLYFRERMPWRIGTVALDAGPVVTAHLHGDVVRAARVRMTARLDRAGQGVLVALPAAETDTGTGTGNGTGNNTGTGTGTPHMEDDPLMRSLTCDPKHRRVLITDGRNANTPALIAALRAAGAAAVYVGMAEAWRGAPVLEAEILPLDLTDSASLARMAGEYGGKTDILINNARHLRPGGVMGGNPVFAREALEVSALGLMRLAQAFGPGMAARSADGTNAAAAWVNILSAHALIPDPAMGGFCAAQAAALSLSRSLRAEFRATGLRVMHVFVGPTEDDWHQPLPPPKLTPNALARDLVQGLRDGLEEVWSGDVAKDIRERYAASPKVLERELTGGGA